jgi:alpha-mannosidase
MSWALNNHWMVNFKASQGGEIPLRYRLTTHEGPCSDVRAARFGREQATPVIVLRGLQRTAERSGQFLQVEEGSVQLIHMKPADFGDGIILRLQNMEAMAQSVHLRFAGPMPKHACLTSPDERDLNSMALSGTNLTVELGPRAIQSLRVTF